MRALGGASLVIAAASCAEMSGLADLSVVDGAGAGNPSPSAVQMPSGSTDASSTPGPVVSSVDGGGLDGNVTPPLQVDAGGGVFESCAAIHQADPAAPSGPYIIVPSGRAPIRVSCEMTQSGGGWTSVVSSDFTKDPCPSPWRFETAAGGCRRSTNGIDAVRFEVPLPQYGEVLLAATGRQYHSADAFGTQAIDQAYVDGLSVTTGEGRQRAHIFTFAVGLTEVRGLEDHHHCPCDQGGQTPPAFVGTSFLCDTASPGAYPEQAWLAEVLWDDDARGLATCAATAGGGTRWVTSTLAQPGRGSIEARLMADQPQENEDIAVRSLVIYIR